MKKSEKMFERKKMKKVEKIGKKLRKMEKLDLFLPRLSICHPICSKNRKRDKKDGFKKSKKLGKNVEEYQKSST